VCIRLTRRDDFGAVLNEQSVRGQVLARDARARPALMEEIAYDAETGQILSGSLMDYALRALRYPRLR